MNNGVKRYASEQYVNDKMENYNPSSDDIAYNNTNNNLNAETVQEAIDELVESVDSCYKKSETYTQEEIDNKIASISVGSFTGNASSIPYDDTKTQFGVNNVQDAIGQIVENLKSLSLSYSNNILYLSLGDVVISTCTIVPTVVGGVESDNTISIDNLQAGTYTLKYENDSSILDGIEDICELEVV